MFCMVLSSLDSNILNLYPFIGILGRRQTDYTVFFLFFPAKKGFDISCKLSPYKTICIKYQSLFSGEKKKIRKIFQKSSDEIIFTQSAKITLEERDRSN